MLKVYSFTFFSFPLLQISNLLDGHIILCGLFVFSHLETVEGEAEVVVEDGEEDNDDDEPEDDTDGTET